MAVLMDSAGHVPLIGDNDSGRIFPLAQREDTYVAHLLPLAAVLLDEEDLAIGPASPELALFGGPAALAAYQARTALSAARGSRALHASGFFVLGQGDDQLLIRCGPLRYRAVNVHEHLDQLSLTLTVNQHPIIVDPGQYCYTPWPQECRRFLVTQIHNTVTVDDQPQCRMIPYAHDPTVFSLIRESVPRCHTWEVDDAGARFRGAHRGYRRLSGGGDHIRSIRYDVEQRAWHVNDRLLLKGKHALQWRFHLHPDVQVSRDGDAWLLARDAARVALRFAGVPGDCIRDWHAPAYGRKVETAVLLFRLDSHGPVDQTFVLQVEP
jgi:uncharacterized heparinase superfamily protein